MVLGFHTLWHGCSAFTLVVTAAELRERECLWTHPSQSLPQQSAQQGCTTWSQVGLEITTQTHGWGNLQPLSQASLHARVSNVSSCSLKRIIKVSTVFVLVFLSKHNSSCRWYIFSEAANSASAPRTAVRRGHPTSEAAAHTCVSILSVKSSSRCFSIFKVFLYSHCGPYLSTIAAIRPNMDGQPGISPFPISRHSQGFFQPPGWPANCLTAPQETLSPGWVMVWGGQRKDPETATKT